MTPVAHEDNSLPSAALVERPCYLIDLEKLSLEELWVQT